MPRIQKGYEANFDTLQEAIKHNRCCLMDCQDKKTKKSVRVVCAINRVDGDYEMVPIAKLFDGNPYDELNPPNPEGGYFEEA